MSSSDQEQLLHQARDKAETLLRALEQDKSSLLTNSDGQTPFAKAIDAARTTLDNLDRALEGAPPFSTRSV